MPEPAPDPVVWAPSPELRAASDPGPEPQPDSGPDSAPDAGKRAAAFARPSGTLDRPRYVSKHATFVPPAVRPIFTPAPPDSALPAFAGARPKTAATSRPAFAPARPASAPTRSATASTRPLTAAEQILDRLDWKVIRRLDGVLQGDYRSLFRGNGVDLVDLREYQPGDDVRSIDWNVTARMDTPYVREYVEDREITAWFLLDLSPSVDFGSVETERLKRTVLTDFVATLARVLTRRGNRVGAILYGGAVERTIPARAGRDQVLRLIDDLIQQPRLQSAPFTDLAPLLIAGQRVVKRRSLIFLVSDFISVPGWERPLNLLNRRHEVVAVRLLDPRELELPDVGPMIMEDAETGERLYVDTHDAGFRRRFEAAASRREAEIDGAFKRSRVEALTLSTEDDLVRAIVRMATIRRRRRV